MSCLVPISEIAEISPSFPKGLKLSPDSLVSFLPMAAVSENGNIIAQDERRLGEVSKGYTYFANGDVLMAKITPCMENGKATFVQNLRHPVGFGSTEFHVLRPSPEVDGKYLFYMIWNPMFRNVAERNMTGTAGQKRVPSSFLKDFKIPLPPLPVQKRIVAILDKADSIRRKRQEAVRLTEELLRSVFLDMFGDPVFNHKKWRTVHLTGVCNSADDIKCGPFGTQLGKDEFTKKGVPLWGIKNVNKFFELPTHEFLTPRTAQRLNQYSIVPGDIVMTRKGTIGNCAVYPENFPFGIMHSDLLRLRVNRQVCEPAFLAHQLHYSRAVEQQIELISGGAIMPGINVTKLKHLEVFVPPVDIQREFTRRTVFIKKIRNTNCTSLFDFENLFNSLLSRSFHGEM